MGKKKYKFVKTRSIQEEWDDAIRDTQSGSFKHAIDKTINSLIEAAYRKMDKSPSKELDPELEEFYEDTDEYDDNIFGTDADTLSEVEVPEEIEEEPIIAEVIEELPKEEPKPTEIVDDFIPLWFKDMPRIKLPRPSSDAIFDCVMLSSYGFIQSLCRKCTTYLSNNKDMTTLYSLNNDIFENIIMSTIEDASEVKSRRYIYSSLLSMIKWAMNTIYIMSKAPYAVFTDKEFDSAFCHILKINDNPYLFIPTTDPNNGNDYVYAYMMDEGKHDFNIEDALREFDDCSSNAIAYIESALTDFLKYASVISSLIESNNYNRVDSARFTEPGGLYYDQNMKTKKHVVNVIEDQPTTEFKIDTIRDLHLPVNHLDFYYTNILSLKEQMNLLNSIINEWSEEVTNIGKDEDLEETSDSVVLGEDISKSEAPKASPMEFAKHYHDNTTHEVVRHDVETIGDDIEIVDEEDIDFSDLTIKPVRKKR